VKKRIVYIISDIQRSLAFEWIAEHLDHSKYDISFLILNPGSSVLEDFLKKGGYNVKHIKCGGKKNWPLAFIQISSYLIKRRPNAVHCHLQQATILGLMAAKLAGIKKRIYTRHHSSLHHVYFPKGIWWDRMCNNIATHIIAISGEVKKILIDWEHVDAEKVILIPHGFLLDTFEEKDAKLVSSLREKYKLGTAHPVVGVISRFTIWKGIQYIIPAFNQLLKTYPNAVLLLFNATGDYEREIDELLAKLPEKNYRKIGFEKEITAAYQLMDIFVHVPIDSHSEAFGQIYVEALAAGIPSIFTLSGIAPDFIKNGENALVVPYKDKHAIYTQMQKLISDPVLRNKLIQNGRSSVREKFTLGQMISQLNNLYS
jgi:glycosyltransferase involved in cell wall biosynthesis